MGELGGDGIGYRRAHAGQATGQRTLHALAYLQVAGKPVGAGPGVAGDDGVVGQARGEFVHHALGVDRVSLEQGAFLQGLVPVCAPAFDLVEPTALGLVFEQWQQCPQRFAGVTDQVDLHGVAQAEHVWLQIDLHATGLAFLRQELGVGEAGTDHQQGVAFAHQPITRFGT